MPRLAAVQAAGAAPVRAAASPRASRSGTRCKAETVATAIRIGDPASYDRAVRAIRETNGVVLAVTDEEILDAKASSTRAASDASRRAPRAWPVCARWSGAGSWRHERVVAVLTGHVLKDPGLLLQYHQDTDPPRRARTARSRSSPIWRGRAGAQTESTECVRAR